MSDWSYKNNLEWEKGYPACSSDNNPNQSPIDIPGSKIKLECSIKCGLTLKYKPSKCFLINDHNTITINYDPGSYLIYQNNWYELRKAEIKIPSLHTYNGEHYQAEIDLYHCSDKQCQSGVVLAIFLERGSEFGDSVEFLNQFIHQSPPNNTQIEREVEVSSDWNIIDLIPSDRTAYVYEGSLPNPPCHSGWTWIVFSQPAKIGITALKALEHNFVMRMGKNIRTPLPLRNDRAIYRIPHNAVKVYEEKNKESKKGTKIKEEDKKELEKSPWEQNKPRLLVSSDYNPITYFLEIYKSEIKNLLIFILFIMLIVFSIKLTKYIIKNDLVNHYLAKNIDLNNSNQSGKGNFNNNLNMSNNNLNLKNNNLEISNNNLNLYK